MGISPFQFTAPSLTNAQFQVLRAPKPEDTVEIHLRRSISRLEDDKNKAAVVLVIQLNKKEDKINEDACFYAEVTMQAMFSWDAGVDEHLVSELLEKNAPSLLVAYARPILMQLTAASPLPDYHLPFLNMNEIFARTDYEPGDTDE